MSCSPRSLDTYNTNQSYLPVLRKSTTITHVFHNYAYIQVLRIYSAITHIYMYYSHYSKVLPNLHLFRSEVDAWNAVPGNPQRQVPSPGIVAICLSLMEWYHLYRQPGHTTLHLLDTLGSAFMNQCTQLFPFLNSKGINIMCTGKVHFIIHAASEILKWGNIINCSAEASEIAHKLWVKGQGDNTNQGPSSAKTMMSHSQKQGCSKDVCPGHCRSTSYLLQYLRNM